MSATCVYLYFVIQEESYLRCAGCLLQIRRFVLEKHQSFLAFILILFMLSPGSRQVTE